VLGAVDLDPEVQHAEHRLGEADHRGVNDFHPVTVPGFGEPFLGGCNRRALDRVLVKTAVFRYGGFLMQTRYGHAARRELAFVLSLAAAGVTLVLLVAFVPWYEPVVMSLAR
jgi:hypothetical protein